MEKISKGTKLNVKMEKREQNVRENGENYLKRT